MSRVESTLDGPWTGLFFMIWGAASSCHPDANPPSPNHPTHVGFGSGMYLKGTWIEDLVSGCWCSCGTVEILGDGPSWKRYIWKVCFLPGYLPRFLTRKQAPFLPHTLPPWCSASSQPLKWWSQPAMTEIMSPNKSFLLQVDSSQLFSKSDGKVTYLVLSHHCNATVCCALPWPSTDTVHLFSVLVHPWTQREKESRKTDLLYLLVNSLLLSGPHLQPCQRWNGCRRKKHEGETIPNISNVLFFFAHHTSIPSPPTFTLFFFLTL